MMRSIKFSAVFLPILLVGCSYMPAQNHSDPSWQQNVYRNYGPAHSGYDSSVSDMDQGYASSASEKEEVNLGNSSDNPIHSGYSSES